MMFTERISEDANQAWKCSERRKIPDELSLKQSVPDPSESTVVVVYQKSSVPRAYATVDEKSAALQTRNRC